jgi:transcriptional regulator with XRE-family HTH domain
MNLREFGAHVRERRESLGLTQGRLAKLAGLSRATINQLETGTLNDLGVTKLAALMDVVGLRLEVASRAGKAAGPRRSLLKLSRTASVSYKTPLEPGQLTRALVTGELPDALLPHMATLLDEAPLPLVASAVEEAAERGHVPPKRIWRHLERWAQQLHSPRQVWA